MVKSIFVPQAGGIIDFPDEATPQEMLSYIDTKYGAPAPAPPAAPGPDQSGILGRLAYGFGTGITDIPGGIASLFLPAEQVAKTSAGQFSDEARRYLEESLGIDPTKEVTTPQMLAQGLGSVASFLVPGGAVAKGASLLGKGAALAGRIGTGVAAGQGVALGAGSRTQKIQQQLASGMEISEEDQLAAQRLDGLIGASEALPMGKFFSPLTTILSKVPAAKAPIVEQIFKSRLARLTRSGIEEGAQEAAAGIANDLVEYGVYNPDVEIGQDILSNAGTGAFAGTFIEGVLQLAAGRRLRPYRQLQADLAADQRQAAAELYQGRIAQSADELVKAGVRGEVSIEEVEDPAGFTKFTIKDKVGQPIADFDSIDAAARAIDLYKRKSGVDVNVRAKGAEPAGPEGPIMPPGPKVPLRVGKTKFPDIAALQEARKKHLDEIAKINIYKGNGELLVKQAAANGVTPIVYAQTLDNELTKNKIALKKYDDYIASLSSQEAPTVVAPPQKPGTGAVDLSGVQTASIPYETLSYDAAQNKAVQSSGENNIIDYGGRKVVVVSVNGVNVPFYLSTGSGGKKNVAAGKWYPFFGIGADGWINKTNEFDINNYYGSPELRAAAEKLDATIGDVRSNQSIPKVKATGSHIDFINQGLSPASNQEADTIDRVNKNIENVKTALSAGGGKKARQEIVAPSEEGIASLESNVPAEVVAPEPITDYPIGVAEAPVTDEAVPDRAVIEEEPAAPVEPLPEMKPLRQEMRTTATDEQLTDLQTELFGQPMNVRQMTPEQLSQYEAERDRRFPQEPVDIYYSGSPTTAAPTLKMAQVTGPNVKDYSPETQAWIKGVYTKLQNRLSGIVPKQAEVRLQTLIDRGPGYLIRGQASTEPSPDGIKSIIDLSTGILKPDMTVEDAVKVLVETLNHEIIHVIRQQGVIRPEEWRILSRAAMNTKVPGKKYTYFDKAEAVYAPNGVPMSEDYADPDAVVEEAVAEMYKDWVKKQNAPPQTRGLFNRITEFFRRIFRVLRDSRHEEFFKAVERGEVGGREGEAIERPTLFSAAPVDQEMAGYQDESGVHIRPFPDDAVTSSTAYLRENFKRFKGKGRYLDEQWGRALDEAFLKKFGRTYDINDPADYAKIVDAISDEVRLQMKQAQSGVGWYDSDIQDVFDELAKSFPILKDPADGPAMRQMFTVIAGVMSNGMKAKANVELAAINFAHFLSTGRFSPTHPFTKTGWNQRSNIMGPQIAMLNSMIDDPMFAPRQGSNNPRIERFEKFLRYMFTEHSVREINAFRARHGTKSPAKIGKFEDRRLGMYAFGPKFGPFILNLNGLSDETVDSWASRSFYRHMGRSIGPDGQLYKAPLTSNREAMKRALRDVGAQTNLSSRDIQAVLWFYEKELYNQLGQSNPLEVFSDGAREFTRKYGARTAGPSQPRAGREGEVSRAIKAAGARTGQSIPRGPRFSAAPTVGSPEFKRWFGNSKAANPDGTPIRFYHGTPFSFKEFGKGRSGSVKNETGPFYFSTSPKYANQYAETKIYAGGDGSDVKKGGKVFPVYISAQNPFDYENPEHVARLKEFVRSPLPKIEEGFWKTIENPVTQRAIRDLGFDGFYLNEAGFKNLAVYRPEQIKSIFNQFPEGEATRSRFSAAPLPPYVQQQNNSLFAPTPKVSFKDMMFNFAFGSRPISKTLNTQQGVVDLSTAKMAALTARSAAVDKGAYIEEIEKQFNKQTTGNFQRMVADYSATAALAWRRRATHLLASMMLRGKMNVNFARPGDIQSATMQVVDDPDSLKNIFDILLQPGAINPTTGKPDDKRDIFKSYAVAKRGEWLAATGQTVPREITPQYIRETIPFVQREYPEVVEAYNMYQRFNKNLLTAAKDAGLISAAELSRLTNQMNYYGFIYEVYGEPLGPSTAQKTASKFKLRPYTGTQYGGMTADPMFVMIQNANFWVESMAKNLAAVKSFKLAELMGEARLLGSTEDPDPSRGEENDVMYFSENGQVKRFAVRDPLLVVALGSDDRIDVGRFWEIMGIPTRILRESVTRDPGFMVANLMRDTLSTWITSGADITPFLGTMKGMANALKDGASFKTLGSYGAVGSYDLAMLGPADLAATLRQKSMPKNIHTVGTVGMGTAALGSLWNRLGAVSEASDAATRIAVYEAAKAKGLSDAEAALQAIEILDFTRRGGSQTLGILTKIIPFLNARIQGMDVLYQAGRAGIRYATGRSMGERDANLGKKFLVRGAMLAAISMALEYMNDDDEDYEQLDDYIKNGNLLIPLSPFGLDNEFIAIPKPFEAGLLFSTIPQQFYKSFTGDATSRENIALFTSQLASTFGVNPIPQVLLPAYEVITNHDFYTGLPLISEGKMRLAPELQYNASTSQVAMILGKLPIKYNFDSGKFEGISPIVIDNLISGYGGPLGTYLAQATGIAMEGVDIGPERIPQDITRLPVVKRFFIDAETKNPKVVSQAYELFRLADEANRSFSRLRQTGDAEAVADYLDENRDILAYKKYIFKMADRLNKLSAQERVIERDQTMTDEEKLEAVRKLREVSMRIAAKVSEINRVLGR